MCNPLLLRMLILPCPCLPFFDAQALETCSNGQYCGMGKSAGNYTIIPIDSRPSWLMALVGVFCACGPIALAAFFFGERHMKKNK